MFRGEFEHNLDEKGRLLLPARFRDELGETIILTRGAEGQINLFPRQFFDDMERRVEESDDSEYISQTSRILSASSECEVDRQGRIVLPPMLRRHGNLGSEVIVLGNRHHVEIWNPDQWLQYYNRWVTTLRASSDDTAKMRGMRLEL